METSEIGPSGGPKDGLLQAFPSVVVSQNCENQNFPAILMPHSVCGRAYEYCNGHVTTQLGLAQVEFANIEMYLCESLHRSLMLDWC